MAKKYITDVMKVADISEGDISKETFVFLTTACEGIYKDESERGEDLITFSEIGVSLSCFKTTEETRKEIKAIIRQAKARDCGYIRVIE